MRAVAVGGERVNHRGVQRARIALIAVGTAVGEADGRGHGMGQRLGPPHHMAEPLPAAVQVVPALVQRQLVQPAVQIELATRDAERDAADGAAEIRALRLVLRQGVEAEHEVRHGSLPIGSPEFRDRGPVGDQADHHAAVAQRVPVHRHAVRGRAKRFFLDHRIVHCHSVLHSVPRRSSGPTEIFARRRSGCNHPTALFCGTFFLRFLPSVGGSR